MKVYVLITKWKDGDPDISGVFSSFDKAVAYFVRVLFNDATMSVTVMQSKVAKAALKLAHKTDDEDFSCFGEMKAWVEEYEVNSLCEAWEIGDGHDGE